MTDELVKRLVDWDEYDEGKLNDMREEAKARIEQLTAERDEAWAYMSALQGDLYDAIMIKAERDRLREALRPILRFVPQSIVECRGDKCREPWCASCCGEDAANAALDRAQTEAADAHAALKGATP